MKPLQNIIIEGPDNCGKGTLITNIQNDHPEYVVLHSGKPYSTKYPIETQFNYFKHGNSILQSCGTKIIYDRFHLGEYVYGNLYRGLDIPHPIDFVNKYEHGMCIGFGAVPHYYTKTLLVLLTSSSFTHIPDDGLSINTKRINEEQDMFKKAFEVSYHTIKVMIDVSIFDKEKNCWKFKSPKDIYDEVIKYTVSRGYYL